MFPMHQVQSLALGPLEISSAAFFHALAFVVFSILVIHSIKKYRLVTGKFDRKVTALIFYVVLFSLLGGRIWFAVFDRRGWDVWHDFINPNVAGLTSFGMLFGGIIGIFFAVRRIGIRKMTHTVKIVDTLAFFLPLWIAVYRVGCLLFGCCYGKETDVAWGIQYIGQEVIRHPTQLYSIISALIIFGILWFFFRKEKTEDSRLGKRFDGEIALWFLLLYSAGRFTIDNFRWYPEWQYWGGFTIGQWVCLLILVFASIMIIREYHHVHKGTSKLTNMLDLPKKEPKITR